MFLIVTQTALAVTECSDSNFDIMRDEMELRMDEGRKIFSTYRFLFDRYGTSLVLYFDKYTVQEAATKFLTTDYFSRDLDLRKKDMENKSSGLFLGTFGLEQRGLKKWYRDIDSTISWWGKLADGCSEAGDYWEFEYATSKQEEVEQMKEKVLSKANDVDKMYDKESKEKDFIEKVHGRVEWFEEMTKALKK